jgi:hypothetical protein
MNGDVVGLQKYGDSHRQAFKAATHFLFNDTDAGIAFYFQVFAFCRIYSFFVGHLRTSKHRSAITLFFSKSFFSGIEFAIFYPVRYMVLDRR